MKRGKFSFHKRIGGIYSYEAIVGQHLQETKMISDSELDAQRIMETLCPNPALRATYISIIADGIIEANRYSRSLWCLNMSDDEIRLTVTHYYVCTIDRKGIWLALDDDFFHDNEHNQKYLPTIHQLNEWGWKIDNENQRGAYPTYKDRSKRTDFSVNGYYSVGENHDEVWKHIRRLFSGLIYKAIYYGQDMDERSPEKHCSGFLKYVRNQFGIELPDPLYDLQE
ncbi:MAG: hypothetical protein M3Y68_08095 [Chloroflexota bacterium]|nr:hypothetical protein [Chloroflexota bacterium]